MAKAYSNNDGLAYKRSGLVERPNTATGTAHNKITSAAADAAHSRIADAAAVKYSDYAAAFEQEQIRLKKRKMTLFRLSALIISICLTIGAFELAYTRITGNEPHSNKFGMFLEIKDALVPASNASFDPADIIVERIKSQVVANNEIYESERNPLFDISSLQSSAALLANLGSGDVILQKNQKMRVYPASLTKIMTILLALEYRGSIPEVITMDMGIYPMLYSASSTMAGFLPGENVAVQDLMYGALLPSGGECCVALAVAISGTEEGFADLMNQRAKELGMSDTHFTNSTGLHDPEHFTTVRDLGILLCTALNNKTFREVFSTEEYKTLPTNFRKDGWLLESGFARRAGQRAFAGGEILGGKTGYTPEAGHCLATLAIKSEQYYIFVSTGNNVESTGELYSIADALNVYVNGIR